MKTDCDHSEAEQTIVAWVDYYNDLKITRSCGQCGKVLEGYVADVNDIKELLLQTMRSVTHPKIHKYLGE